MIKRALIFAVLLSLACTAATPRAVNSPGATPSLTPTPTPVPRRAPVAQQAVYAQGGGIWVYDVRTNAVSEIAKGEAVRLPRWIGTTQISFVQGGQDQANVVRVLDTRRRSVDDVVTVPSGIAAYGWSPDRSALAYVTIDRFGYPHVHFYDVLSGVTRTVTTLARALGRGGDPSDQTRVDFSGDGSHVLVVFTPADGDGDVPDDQSQLQVRTLEGALAFAVTHDRDPTMATWGADGKTIYYRSAGAVRSWTIGASRSVAVRGGVAWFNPWPSRDRRWIAFDTGATSARVEVQMLDLRTGRRLEIATGAFHPVIADARTVWVQSVRCDPDCADSLTGPAEVYAVDIRSKQQRRIAITSLLDVDVRYA